MKVPVQLLTAARLV
uniref:Uncharacterized protein n=1 Tax=Anguilla anguilla TaxID=7936 RepID=A0A0E9XRS1_ANGAN